MLITLLTDFGTADHFVAAMKAVILTADPRLPVVDITHEVPPQDVRTAAFTLLAVYDTFPSGTIHVAVVDPGVGSTRRPIIVHAAEQWFVGPDNGLFSWVLDRESGARVFHLHDERFFRQPVSTTFHGRDIFAPAAAALATGAKMSPRWAARSTIRCGCFRSSRDVIPMANSKRPSSTSTGSATASRASREPISGPAQTLVVCGLT